MQRYNWISSLSSHDQPGRLAVSIYMHRPPEVELYRVAANSRLFGIGIGKIDKRRQSSDMSFMKMHKTPGCS